MRALKLALLAAATAVLAVASCSRTSVDFAAPDAGLDARRDAPHDVALDVYEAGPDVADGSPCESGADCASDRYCTVGTCDPAKGCVFSPRDCSDGFACTNDSCDEEKMACEHTPIDSECPADELCSPLRGCASFIYGCASDGHLYEVDVPGGALHDVGDSPAFASDIALAPSGTLFSTDTYVLYASDRSDATTKAVGSIMPLHQYNGLGSRPDGTLWATADVPTFFEITPSTAAATPLGALPDGYRASGDVTAAVLTTAGSPELHVTLTPNVSPPTDALALASSDGQSITVIGDTGVDCVWGLATLGRSVYGLTCQGLLVSLDTSTGQATTLAQLEPAFFGAAGR